jgi:hypothetical protein
MRRENGHLRFCLVSDMGVARFNFDSKPANIDAWGICKIQEGPQ